MVDHRDVERCNMAVVCRLLEEGYGQGNMSVLPHLVSPDYVGRLGIGDHYGPEGMRIDIAAYRALLPDLSVTIDDLFASGDTVARRFTLRGNPRSVAGQPVNGPVELHGVAIDRLAGGLLVESWVVIAPLPLGS
jgi:predicted ester cyclase